jgi:hypothetical protein
MSVTSVKLLDTLHAALFAQVGVNSGLAAPLVRTVVDNFIAFGHRAETTRALGLRFNAKVGDGSAIKLRLNPELRAHYHRAAKAAGVTFSSLVNSALAAHFFGLVAPTVAVEAKSPPVTDGWRKVLLALDVGTTREFLPQDLGAPVTKAKANLFAAAAEVRRSIPGFRVITQQVRGTLYVARTA